MQVRHKHIQQWSCNSCYASYSPVPNESVYFLLYFYYIHLWCRAVGIPSDQVRYPPPPLPSLPPPSLLTSPSPSISPLPLITTKVQGFFPLPSSQGCKSQSLNASPRHSCVASELPLFPFILFFFILLFSYPCSETRQTVFWRSLNSLCVFPRPVMLMLLVWLISALLVLRRCVNWGRPVQIKSSGRSMWQGFNCLNPARKPLCPYPVFITITASVQITSRLFIWHYQ